MINRRKLRLKLGTRRSRRAGTKTKAIPGTGGGVSQRVNKYRYPRNIQPRPAVMLERLIRQAEQAA